MKKLLLLLITLCIINISTAAIKNIDDDIQAPGRANKLKEQRELAAQQAIPNETKEFISRVKNLKSLSASFEQSEKNINLKANSNNNKIISGKLIFSKPDKLYWEVISPKNQQQKYISNGNKIWHYDVGLEQVVIDDYSINKIISSPLYILLDSSENIAKNYKVEKLDSNSYLLKSFRDSIELNNNGASKESGKLANDSVIDRYNKDKLKKIESKDNTRAKQIVSDLSDNSQSANVSNNYITDLRISFKNSKNNDSNIIEKISFVAGLNKYITIEFSKIQINRKYSIKTFSFKPPRGVDVISADELV